MRCACDVEACERVLRHVNTMALDNQGLQTLAIIYLFHFAVISPRKTHKENFAMTESLYDGQTYYTTVLIRPRVASQLVV